MKFLSLILIAGSILLVATKSSLASLLPADIEKCHYEDGKCIQDRIQQVANNHAKTGIRSAHLVPFDPLHINRLKLSRNPDSPVSINLDFQNVDLIGLHSVVVKSVSGFDANAKKPIEVKAFVNKLTLKAQYEVDGRVLILPIVGKGDAEIKLENMEIMIKAKGKLITKGDDGLKYFEVTGFQLLIDPKKVYFGLEGLFGQNKEVGDNMLNFINENWQDIFRELQPDIQEALSKIFKQLVNTVFAKAPYSEYFLDSSN